MENQKARRFPRIFLQKSSRPLTHLLGAKAIWNNREQIDVHDLSYVGAAFVRSLGINAQPGETVAINLELSGQPPFHISCEVMRVSDKLIAVAFAPLSTEARVGLERYLQEKMIGLHMHPIDPKYFAKPGQFSHWFHGPNNTNLFLWHADMRLTQATVELGPDFLIYKNGEFAEGNSEQFLDHENDDYVKPLFDKNLESSEFRKQIGLSPLMTRTLNVLSQIDDPEKVVEPLIRLILERRK